MEKKIQLSVTGLTFSHSQKGAYALILNETEGNRRLPIIIGGFEAQAIAIELEKMRPPRPLTHDLFKHFADSFGVSVIEVIIHDLKEGIFKAKLICKSVDKIIELDSRTSDAIALALRFECPIYTYENLLAEAGIILDDDKNEPATEEDEDEDEDDEIDSPKPEPKKEATPLKYDSYSTTELNDLMQEAIKNEEYEKASRIRDEINKRKE